MVWSHKPNKKRSGNKVGIEGEHREEITNGKRKRGRAEVGVRG